MSETTNVWRCTVCGYIHRGPEPPEQCPVCGVGREAFEPYSDETTTQKVETPTHAWKCLNCTYVHAGSEPPDPCPVCGAPADRFKPTVEGFRESQAPAESVHLVIAGAGVAGVSAAESARRSSPNARVTLLSKEKSLPYYRLNLTRYLAGDTLPDQLPLHPESWYEEQEIELRLGATVSQLDLERRQVVLGDDERIEYGKLILTAGSHPFVPPIPGSHREGVVTLRTIDDAELILAEAKAGKRVMVLGGGVLGLEAAAGLVRQGYSAEVFEGFGWLLPRQLNQRAGEILADRVADLGVTVHTSVKVKEVVGDECVRGLELDGGRTVEGELLIVATGVRANSHLARSAGLEVNHGVVVDNFLRTSDHNVFAAGDLAEHQGVLYGTWGPAQFQGSIAGMNAVGDATEFGGIPRSNNLKVLDVDLFSVGVVAPDDGSYEELDHETEDGDYYRFLFHDGALVGAILLGDASLTAKVTKLVENADDLSKLLHRRPTGAQVVEDLKAS